jgi:hypothetical protein
VPVGVFFDQLHDPREFNTRALSLTTSRVDFFVNWTYPASREGRLTTKPVGTAHCLLQIC